MAAVQKKPELTNEQPLLAAEDQETAAEISESADEKVVDLADQPVLLASRPVPAAAVAAAGASDRRPTEIPEEEYVEVMVACFVCVMCSCRISVGTAMLCVTHYTLARVFSHPFRNKAESPPNNYGVTTNYCNASYEFQHLFPVRLFHSGEPVSGLSRRS